MALQSNRVRQTNGIKMYTSILYVRDEYHNNMFMTLYIYIDLYKTRKKCQVRPELTINFNTRIRTDSNQLFFLLKFSLCEFNSIRFKNPINSSCTEECDIKYVNAINERWDYTICIYLPSNEC